MRNIERNYDIPYEEFIKDILNKYTHFSKFAALMSPNGTGLRRRESYLIAEHNGWLERVARDIEENHKKEQEKVYQKLKENVKRKYLTYGDLIKDRSSYEYNQLRHYKWHKRIREELFPNAKIIKESGYWDNFERCLEESKKYVTRKEFANKSGTAYYYSRKRYYDKEKNIKWIDMMIPKHNMENKIGNVYYYLFENIVVNGKKGAMYIGITIHPKRRDNAHRTQDNSAVYRFAKKYNIKIPQMKFFEQKISVQETRKKEGEYVEKYKDKYFILNKAKCGEDSSSVGAYNSNDLSFFSYKQLLECVKSKYNSYNEFLGTKEYKKAFNECWIRKICKDCGFALAHNYYNTINEFIEDVSNKYKTFREFRYKGKSTRHNTNEWVTAMRHQKDNWLIKTVETLFPDNIKETENFINKSKSKYCK